MNYKGIYRELCFKVLAHIGLVFILLILIFSVGGCATAKYDQILHISFSPERKKLLFDRYRDDRPTMIHVYDMETGELNAYSPPRGEGWYEARYSFDGKHIVFSIIPQSIESNKLKQELANTQIAVMDPTGKNVQKITHRLGWKSYPSFSHDGKKVIFAKAGKLGEGKRVPAIFYDAYEVDLESGFETRLTWFKFDEMSPPFYFPDDEKFIFSAWGAPNRYPGVAENDQETIQKKKSALERKALIMTGTSIIADNIYICEKGQEELPEPFVKPDKGYLYRNPQIIADSLIYFERNKEIIKYSPDGNHRSIHKIDKVSTAIKSYSISPEGEQLAIVIYGGIDQERTRDKIVIYNVKDDKIIREIILPDAPAPIINRQ